MSISSSSHSHRLPIFQVMKSSIDLNDQESRNKDSKARWALGALVCLALPFYKRILRIEDGLEKTVETVVEGVEKAAETTEKIASDIANALPEGKLKQVVLEVENIAEQIDDGAEKIEEFLDKVEKIEDKVEDLVEPITEEGKK
ncbi:uncharacterized protein LOC120263830 isoform X2 [Dioscorea cayenensis subsp. rotundata]|uniref:Uncharacterized protein LOC120263830 isoform X2 n=1 Tax=Dioscorea cayennensis subsp. rotundata TaxID=55577 RepID=A0AB40BK11_DIOCR|nr:uncharacterized protein LOC120263830 isoform X2 [Dioscorea cayenensis subsp. rotundata]